jgi:hypothetical protein
MTKGSTRMGTAGEVHKRTAREYELEKRYKGSNGKKGPR